MRSFSQNITNVGIHVLHDCVISQEEHAVLCLGLNFVPPPDIYTSKYFLNEAFMRFQRNVRLKKHFAMTSLDTNSIEDTPESFLHLRVNKSLTLQEANAAFMPDIFRCPIENYLSKASNMIKTLPHTNKAICPLLNPTTYIQQRNAVFKEVRQQLYSRQDIIIKPADKNLGVTIINRQWYINEALGPKYLGDSKTYQQVTQYPDTNRILNDLHQICKEQMWLSNIKISRLTKDLVSDVTRDKVKLCRLYFLPKLHKPTLAFRPICSSQGWVTYWTSVYIHLTLFPLLKQTQSYINNSANLVSKIG